MKACDNFMTRHDEMVFLFDYLLQLWTKLYFCLPPPSADIGVSVRKNSHQQTWEFSYWVQPFEFSS